MGIINCLQGFAMAIADSVPGVSGGTVAFLMGFYDLFIGSLNDIMSTDLEKRKKAFSFLVRLGIGWIIGMGLSATILAVVFEKYIYSISSLFLGFIIAAIPIIIKSEKEVIKGHLIHLLYSLLGIVSVIMITVINNIGGNGLDINNLSLANIALIFIGGMLGISAMVLPGISGSTLLLVFGLYVPIITGIKEILQFNFEPLPLLIIFGIGVIIGAIVVVKWIKLGLLKYRSQMIYLILGLMVGSLYAIVNGPTTLEVPMPPMSLKEFSIIFFFIGAALVLLMEYSQSTKTAHNKE